MSLDGQERITVSRDALRAELGELELRLVDRLSEALKHKADATLVQSIDGRVALLELSKASREHLAPDVDELRRRVTKVEENDVGVEAVSTYKRWMYGSWGLALTVTAINFAERFIHT